MKYLVTGASGFVGHALVERLVRDGHRVRALVRRTSKRDELTRLGVEFAEGDVTDARSVDSATQGIEVVVHAAGLVKAARPEEIYGVNEGGTRNVASAAVKAGVKRLIYVSSGAAGGPSWPGRPRREEDPDRPATHYGKSKRAGEQALREFASRLDCVVVRPSVVYGPRDQEFLGLVFFAAKLGVVPKTGFKDKHYSLIHSSDLADIVVRAVERGKRLGANGDGLYYAADGRDYRWEDFAHLAGEALGKRVFVVPTPELVTWIGAVFGTLKGRLTGKPEKLNLDKVRDLLPASQTFSNERARSELGFAPQVDAHRGFREAAEWFRANGLL
jgi:dihydroflavonol-4-reductase